MRASQQRTRWFLAILAMLLVLALVPQYAHAEEGAPEAEAYETEELALDELADPEAQVIEDASESSGPETADDPSESEVIDVPEEPADPEADAAPAEPELAPQADEPAASVTVKNVRLYDLDGTQQTLSDDYDCQKRFVIVGRPGCGNTRNVVSQALSYSTYDEFADVSFLVLDIDGDWNTFEEGFASSETERVRFFSSNSSAYNNWAWWAYNAIGDEGSSVTLPFIVLIDKSNHVQAVLTGPQNVASLCRTYLSSNESNPDDVDPGDPDQFGTREDVEPEDPAAYDESFHFFEDFGKDWYKFFLYI